MNLRETRIVEDALIVSLIQSAMDLCEHETGRALMPQTWELSLMGFKDEICLPHVPVASIVSVKYSDVTGAEQTLATTDYVFDNACEISPRVVRAVGKSWPAVYGGINNVRIRYVAGYANADAVPAALKQWMKLQIGHWFRNRESINIGNISSKLENVDSLMNAYKIYNL